MNSAGREPGRLGIIAFMILLYTDFGWDGPYVGEMKAAIAQVAPGVPVIDLMHDAPAFDPRRAAYHLAALTPRLPAEAILVGVVDPGVGGERLPILVEADGRRYVGPDNGLFAIIARRAHVATRRAITWRPSWMSASFHGRDLFAPFAARLAMGLVAPTAAAEPKDVGAAWPDDLAEIVYLDRYGNAMTGLRADGLDATDRLEIGGRVLERARTFSDVPAGEAFWYENASGLVEIAVNRGSAARDLGLALGQPVTLAR